MDAPWRYDAQVSATRVEKYIASGEEQPLRDVHGGEVTVVVLTEIEDSKEDGEVRAEQIRRARRGRERREQHGEG